MASQIDPGKFLVGVVVKKLDLQEQFAIAQSEITALQNAVSALQTQVDDLAGLSPPTVDAPVSAGELTIDLSQGQYFEHTLSENITSFAFTNAVVGAMHDIRLRIKQAAASSYTVTWAGAVDGNAATFSWAVAAPTMTSTFDKYDLIGLRIYPVDQTKIYGFIEAQGRD